MTTIRGPASLAAGRCCVWPARPRSPRPALRASTARGRVAAEVGLRDLPRRVTADVHHREDQLVGGEPLEQAPDDPAEQRGLARPGVAERDQVLVADAQLEERRLHRVLPQPERQQVRLVHRVGQLLGWEVVGQQPDRRRRRARPSWRRYGRPAPRSPRPSRRRRCRPAPAAQPGRTGSSSVSSRPGWSGRMVAASLRPITESAGSLSRSSQPGADQRLVGHPQLVPPGHREHHVDAEAAAALQQGDHGVLQLLEVGPQLGQPVDQQDHVGRDQLGDPAGRVLRAQHRPASRCRGRGTPAPAWPACRAAPPAVAAAGPGGRGWRPRRRAGSLRSAAARRRSGPSRTCSARAGCGSARPRPPACGGRCCVQTAARRARRCAHRARSRSSSQGSCRCSAGSSSRPIGTSSAPPRARRLADSTRASASRGGQRGQPDRPDLRGRPRGAGRRTPRPACGPTSARASSSSPPRRRPAGAARCRSGSSSGCRRLRVGSAPAASPRTGPET